MLHLHCVYRRWKVGLNFVVAVHKGKAQNEVTGTDFLRDIIWFLVQSLAGINTSIHLNFLGGVC
jgi:hypothetical protein